MTKSLDAPGYWETTGAAKTFTHPLDRDLLAAHVPRGARVLDFGCGYGRLTAELVALGHPDAHGVDTSAALVRRGRAEHPGLSLEHCPALPLPHADGAFGAALLFAVLTCVPDDAAQRAVVAELARLVRPGGVLYLSDVPLQNDPRNLDRYREQAERHGAWGVFEIPDGGVFRHHDPDHLRALVTDHGFAIEAERRDTVGTLDGHTVERLQLVARRAG
ncbi:class I SAM-dependent methyltransferase [Streptomyces radicis]|uniref:Class I SAM-dependent methyltransferase n=1 Tax=Streptomyces radicis TaxID=1750517 RepID=A0A3A9WGB2_9ACTN|nr:class I SAM-dependent methyltransferase [Streptomyces radicis]RKN11995.1 class I SAM-dependent methyltransferase [Streptomyces radicis]RKN25954.1 class I SAM-dependent methyltransferase [Streptomyces radicis]